MQSAGKTILCNKELLACLPAYQQHQIKSAEIRSMLRSDLVLTNSDYEYMLLRNKFNIQHTELITYFYPLSEFSAASDKNLKFAERKHFFWMGQHDHSHNRDQLDVLLNHIWPKIHQKLPQAELHLFGINQPNNLLQSISYSSNVRLMGYHEEIDFLPNYRLSLNPLRFGAGAKGQILNAWKHFVPVVTTPIGSEGLYLESLDEVSYGNLDLTRTYMNE